MANQNWRSLGVKTRSIMNDWVSTEYQSQLRSAVREGLSGYALSGIQLQRSRPTGPTNDALEESSARHAQRLIVRIRIILRRAAIPECLRYVGQGRDQSVRADRLRSLMGNFIPLREAIFEIMLDRHFPAWRNVKSISIDELPQGVYELMVEDLKARKIDADFLDFACGCFLSDALYICKHLVCVSFRVGMDENAISVNSLLHKLNDLIESPDASPADFEEAEQLIASVNNAVKLRGDETAEEQDRSASGANVDLPKISGVLAGALVTSPVSWSRFRSQVEEHFPSAVLPSVDEVPEKWAWLCDASQYLVVFYANAGLGEASNFTQLRLRRLNALARCFRQEAEPDQYSIAGAGFLWWGWDGESAADCRLLALATSDPQAYTNKVAWSGVQPNPKWKIRPETDEFVVAGRPFVTVEGFKALESAGLMDCWRWIETDASEEGRQARLALESYETAMSLGGGRGAISPDMEEGWSLIAMMTCLEAIFCVGNRQNIATRVLDGVHQSLLGSGFSNIESLNARAVVLEAQKARNNLIHSARLIFDGTRLADLPSIVARVLRRHIVSAQARHNADDNGIK